MSFCSRMISAAGLILLLLEENPDDGSIAGIGILAASAAARSPARWPKVRASVIAFPDRRLAPFAPPTASPAAKRCGTVVCMSAPARMPPMW